MRLGLREGSGVGDRVREAEGLIAVLRMVGIGGSILVFLFLFGDAPKTEWLAYTVAAASFVYSALVVAFRPEQRLPALAWSVTTTLADTVFVGLWLVATGGFASPFYLLWFLAVVAVAARFDARVTVVVSCVYAAADLALAWWSGAFIPANAAAIVVRSSYVVLAGILAAWVARTALVEGAMSRSARADAALLEAAVADRTRKLMMREAQLEGSRAVARARSARASELDRLKATFRRAAGRALVDPLSPIRLQLHLLQSSRLGALNERQRRATEILEEHVRRLALLVQDVSDVARIETGDLRLQREPVELSGLVDEVLMTWDEAAQGRSVALLRVTTGECWVHGDAVRLGQAVSHLVANAIAATKPHGEVLVRVEASPRAAVVTVTDDGRGFTAAQRARLFQPFSQIHKEAGATEPGPGLGLVIVKGILEAHGGSVTCFSDGPDHGASFVLRLERLADAGHGRAGTWEGLASDVPPTRSG